MSSYHSCPAKWLLGRSNKAASDLLSLSVSLSHSDCLHCSCAWPLLHPPWSNRNGDVDRWVEKTLGGRRSEIAAVKVGNGNDPTLVASWPQLKSL